MAEKRGRKAPQVPFVDAGKAVTEAVLAPAKSAGLVPTPGEPSPLEPEIEKTVAALVEAAAPAKIRAEPPKPAVAKPAVAKAAAVKPVAPTVAASAPVPADPLDVSAPAPAPLAAEPGIAATMRETAEPVRTTSTNVETPPAMVAPLLKGFLNMATAPEMNYAAGTERFQALFGDINERAKTAVEKSAKVAEDLTELTKGNVEALVASGRIAAKGAESLTQDAAEYGKKSFESATGALKSFAAVKSPTELFQLQSEFAKSSFDTAVAEASKFSESMLKLMGEIAQPLSTRYAVAAEKFKTSAF